MIPLPKIKIPTSTPFPHPRKVPVQLSFLPTCSSGRWRWLYHSRGGAKPLGLAPPLSRLFPLPPPQPQNLVGLVVSPVSLLAMPCLPLFNLTLKMNPTGQCFFRQLKSVTMNALMPTYYSILLPLSLLPSSVIYLSSYESSRSTFIYIHPFHIIYHIIQLPASSSSVPIVEHPVVTLT